MKALPFLRVEKTGVRLRLRVQPGASRSAFAGIYGESLKLAVKAPPVDGKANTAVIEFVADFFSLPKRDVNLVSGETSRDKVVLIEGISLERASELLRAELE